MRQSTSVLVGALAFVAVLLLTSCAPRDEAPSAGQRNTSEARPIGTPRPTPARETPPPYEPDCYGSKFEACLTTSITLDTPGVTAPDCSGAGRRICIVPMGALRPDLVQHLSEHFRGLGFPVQVTPGLDISSDLADMRHSQIDNSSLKSLAVDRYLPAAPEWYDLTMVVLTPIDTRTPDSAPGSFVFGSRYGAAVETWVGVISTFRFDPKTFGDPANDALYFERVRKLTLKYIGGDHFGFPETESSDTVMRVFINSLDLLDSLPERLPEGVGPCQQEQARVCLVPVGDVDSALLGRVADDAERHYGIPVDVLRPVELDPQYRNLVGTDYSADRLITTVWEAYPRLTRREPIPTLIAVTEEEVSFIGALKATNDFHVLAVPNYEWPGAVISLHGLDLEGDTTVELRLRKLLAQQIGILHLGFEPSETPGSPVPYWIQTASHVDALPERLPGY
jgi:predicted Zn-dependent protease